MHAKQVPSQSFLTKFCSLDIKNNDDYDNMMTIAVNKYVNQFTIFTIIVHKRHFDTFVSYFNFKYTKYYDEMRVLNDPLNS